MSVERFKHFDKDYLHTYHKGGDGGMGMMMMMMQQEKREQAARDAAAKAEADKQAQIKLDKENWQKKHDANEQRKKVSKGYYTTLDEAGTKLSGQGYGGEAYETLKNAFTKKMDTVKATLPDAVDNVGDYFNTNGLDDIISEANTNYRSGLTKDLDGFIGDGFANTRFADTADDAFISKILDEQYGTAKGILDRSLARGTLNDTGYASGLSELSRQKTAANGKAQGLGAGVLAGYKTQLETDAKAIRDRANKTNFGTAFDLAGARSSIDSKYNTLFGGLEGDIYNAIGGTEFFDTDKLLGKAGTASGVLNSGGAPAATGVGGSTTPGVLGPLTNTSTNSLDDEELKKRQGVF